MSPTMVRRRSFRRTPQRRRVDIARIFNTFTLAAGVAQNVDLLSVWTADIGLTAGNRLPGLTVGPLMYRMDAQAGSAVGTRISWGIGVFNDMITTAGDFSPQAREHLDWMEWGSGFFAVPAAPAGALQIVGNGDDGFRRTRTKRKIKEVEDSLVLSVISVNSITLDVCVSTVVTLP